jgi:hypothetical protein
MDFQTSMRLAIGVVGFGIWTYIVFYAPELQNSEYLKAVQGAVVAVVALALRDDKKTVAPAEKRDEVKQ